MLAASICGGVIGAKITRLMFAAASGATPQSMFAHPDGRTIIGGIIFGWIAVELVKKKLGIDRSTGDGFALGLAIGEAIGRIGCFFNGCCYGAAANIPWAVFQAGEWRHPAQFYSAAMALSTFAFLLYMKDKVRFEGDLFRIYLVLYGISRFAIEFLRQRSDIHFGLSLAQWASLEIGGAMAITIIWHYHRANKSRPVKE